MQNNYNNLRNWGELPINKLFIVLLIHLQKVIMNQKKLKIILSLPIALFFIANLFYYPLPAKAEESYKF